MTPRNLLAALIVVATAAFVVATSIERSTGESGHQEAAAATKPAVPASAVTTPAAAPAGAETAAGGAKETAAGRAKENAAGRAKESAAGRAKESAAGRATEGAAGAKEGAAGAKEGAAGAKEGAAVTPAVAEPAVTSEAHSSAGGESAATRASEGPVTPAGTTDEQHAELRPLGINLESLPLVVTVALASLALAAGAWLRQSLAPVLGLVGVAMLVFGALDVGEVVHQADVNKTLLAVLAGVVAVLHLVAAAVATVLARRALGAHPRPSTTPA